MKILIGIGKAGLVQAPDTIYTISLGSCVGVVIYDSLFKRAGMAHVMLPYVSGRQEDVGRYADTAIPWMIDELNHAGSPRSHMRAKLAGGATMTKTTAHKIDFLNVGDRNIDAVIRILDQYKIPIVSKDVGGRIGRTVEFDPSTEGYMIRPTGHKEYVI